MKKQMALTLAGVMAMSTLPMSVFAAETTVSVRTVAALAANSDNSKTIFSTSTTSSTGLALSNIPSIENKEGADDQGFEVITSAPEIKISGIDIDAATAQFEVALTVADSSFKWYDKFTKTNFDKSVVDMSTEGMVKDVSRANASNKIIVTVQKDGTVVIPVVGVINSNKAPLIATVRPLDNNSNIATTTLTVATVNESTGGNTTTTAPDTFSGKTNLTFSLLTTESNAGTLGANDDNLNISAKLYDDVAKTWSTATTKTVTNYDEVIYTVNSGFDFSTVNGGLSNLNELGEDEYVQLSTVSPDYGLLVDAYARLGSSKNKLEVIYVVNKFVDVPASVKVTGFALTAKKGTTVGQDVKLSITPQDESEITAQSDLKIGTYADYGYTVGLLNTTAEIPALPAGAIGFDVYTSADNSTVVVKDADMFDAEEIDHIVEGDLYADLHETLAVKVSETVEGSFIAGRGVTFTLPEDVQIVGYKIVASDKERVKSIPKEGRFDSYDPTYVSIDGNEFKIKEFDAVSASGKANFSVKFFVAADANYTGDVIVNVSGDGLAGAELKPTTVATFAPSIIVDTKVTNVKPGVQATATSDIVLTETKNGRFQDGEYVYVQINKEKYATLDNALNIIDADVEVTAGDLSIKAVDIDNKEGLLKFKVDGESSTPSTITISNVKVSTAYGLPDTNVAPFQVQVTTDGYDDSDETNSKDSTTIKYGKITADYINIKSGSGATAGDVVAIQPGSTTYTVNGVEKTMDVAPFIDAASQSMMVPVRFIADGVGITEESGGLQWSATNKTVVIRNGNEILEFPVGANFYRINGVKVDNENGALTQIKDGRTFVPFRTMGNALAIPVSWNPETRTAQYN